jgi:hypothetical protein
LESGSASCASSLSPIATPRPSSAPSTERPRTRLPVDSPAGASAAMSASGCGAKGQAFAVFDPSRPSRHQTDPPKAVLQLAIKWIRNAAELESVRPRANPAFRERVVPSATPSQLLKEPRSSGPSGIEPESRRDSALGAAT